MFFTMYWPNNVNPKGAVVNVSSGKNKNGVNVRNICTIAKFKAVLLNKPSINKTPMTVSQIANKIMDTSGAIVASVSLEIVSKAIVSAGLTPG